MTPNELVLTFGGLHVCVQFGKNRRRNATVRVSTDGHTHTHGQTKNDFIICPMLYAIAMGQIISKAADNADSTQSQARDTRHHGMQEVNSMCTDSGPLRANTVLCHSTRYSPLVCVYNSVLMRVVCNLTRPIRLSYQQPHGCYCCYTLITLTSRVTAITGRRQSMQGVTQFHTVL